MSEAPLRTEAPRYEQYLDCVQCGFCLPACPSFVVLGTEMDSPRGRIHLMRALADGEIESTPAYRTHLETCLACRACETACPSGVQFGDMMEGARAQLQIDSPRLLRRFAVGLATNSRVLHFVAAVGRFAQRSGVAPFLSSFLPSTRHNASLLPAIPDPSIRESYNVEIVPARGARRYRVGLLRGCVADVLFSPANRATIDVLTRNGCEVVMPAEQSCCGSLHAHNGMRPEARAYMRRNIDAFLGADVDVIVTNAAGCGATLKEYARVLERDTAYAERAREFVARVRDVSEFLAGIELQAPTRALDAAVAYHDACLLAHGQGIRAEPRALLSRIPGLRLVELNDGEMCCGSAGIYNITHPDIAGALLERKIAAIRSTGATIVAAANPGCVLQIAAGAARAGLALRVAHPIELLAEAYR